LSEDFKISEFCHLITEKSDQTTKIIVTKMAKQRREIACIAQTARYPKQSSFHVYIISVIAQSGRFCFRNKCSKRPNCPVWPPLYV